MPTITLGSAAQGNGSSGQVHDAWQPLMVPLNRATFFDEATEQRTRPYEKHQAAFYQKRENR
jgi:hypothetical protein